MNETMVTVVGNVVAAPTRKQLEGGVSVASFRIASNRRRYDRETGRWVDGEALFLRVTCWRQLADHVTRSLASGDPVLLTGRLYTREYEVDGQARLSYEVEARAVGFDLSRGVADFHRVRKGVPAGEIVSDDAMEMLTSEEMADLVGGDSIDELAARRLVAA